MNKKKSFFNSLMYVTLVILFSSCAMLQEPNFANRDLSGYPNELGFGYDKFTDVTSVYTRDVRVYPQKSTIEQLEQSSRLLDPLTYLPHHIYLKGFYTCKGLDKGCNPELITFMFESISTEGWKLLESNSLFILYDDERIVIDKPLTDHSTLSGSTVLSYVSVNLSNQVFRDIVSSKNTSARIGIYEIDFDDTVKETMYKMIELFDEKE